jgi:hypothetical protein
MKRLLLIAVPFALLAGCSEIDQSKSAANTNRGDEPAYKGAKDNYIAKGWTPGDKGSWETQMRTRSLTQNEYNKTN